MVEGDDTQALEGHAQEASPAAALAPGQLIAGRFAIEHVAGRGGMGTVYRARDLTTQQPVAIKVMARTFHASGERFAREARSLAALSHPAVVRYVAHGVEGRTQFLAMEWLEGEDLARRLQREGLGVPESVRLIERIAQGLAVAHARGIVHRDLKPSNLFLVDGLVDAAKLLDFGVARIEQQGGAQTLTRAGTLLGTVGYMAPEQALGMREVDAAADVFALGCVLYECLTGVPAFHGANDVAVLAKLLRDRVPPARDLRPALSPELDALLARMLAKERAHRPADASALLSELAALGALSGGPVAVRAPSAPHLVESETRIASVVVARPLGPAATTMHEPLRDASSTEFDQLVARFGAEPLPLRGGLFLLMFGTGEGTVASDRAAQAVRCALRLGRLRTDLAFAVTTGVVESARNVSADGAIERAVALLDLPATRGQVRVDDLTAGLLDGGFEVERAPTGVAVVAEHADDRPRLLLGKPSPCVGRDKELRLLEGMLTEVLDDGVARVLLVTAPPGFGKSRLAREFLARVPHERVRVLIARADPIASGAAWSLLRQLLASGLGWNDRDISAPPRAQLHAYLRERVDAGELEWLTEFLGELAGVSQESGTSPQLTAARGEPALMRAQIRAALERWLRAELATSPLLLVLEDLHWADLPSMTLLEECLRPLQEHALFVLGLARPELHERTPALWHTLGGQEYRLTGLTRRAGERLTRAVLPTELAGPLVERMLDLAQGNAFYLEELIRHVAAGESELPETVRAMAQSRLERLSPEARRHLRAASVFGERSWVDAVGALLGNEREASHNFAELARDEIFVPCAQTRFPGHAEFGFRHALLRDAAYAMLTLEDRKLAHGLAGQWLERAGERDPHVLAEHYRASNEPACAVPFLLSACRAALERGDLPGALRVAQTGLELATGRQRGELLLVRAHASAWGTKTNLELAEQALALLPPGESSWWFALALLVFGASAIGRGSLAEPYLELARQTQLPAAQHLGMHGQAFEVLAVGATVLGRADLGWSLIDKLHEGVTRQARPDPLAMAWMNVAYCQLATNSLHEGGWWLERALHAGERAVQGMRELGAVHGDSTATFHLGMALRELGRYVPAQGMFEHALDTALRAGNTLIASFSRLMLAVLALRAGRAVHGHAELDALAASSDANIVHGANTVRAEAMLRAGDLERARELASAATRGPGLVYRLTAALTLARVERDTGDPTRALRTIEHAIEARGATAFPQLALELHRLRSSLAQALGDVATARGSARAAFEFAAHTVDAVHDPALRAELAHKLQLATLARVAG